MEEKKKENLKWFKHFTEICDEHKIWYTVTNGTLLGAIREKGPIAWDDDYDVMMTPESYEKLQKLFPTNCLDGATENNYPLVIPKFVPDRAKFLESAIFVDIFLVVPSDDKHVLKFRSLGNKTKFSLQTIHSTWRPYAWYIWAYKFVSWPIKWFVKKMTHRTAVQILTSSKHTYYYSIDNPIDPKKINIIPNLTFKTKEKPFANFEVKVPIEYDVILTYKYGKYMIPNPNQRLFIHINAVSIKKIKPIKLKNYSDNANDHTMHK